MSAIDFDSAENLQRLRNQDRDIFGLLVNQFHQQLLIVARAIIGNSLAEEVVQEAWVSAYHALPKFQARSSLKTWLYTIVSNEAKTRLKRESRQVNLGGIDDDPVAYLESGRFRIDGHWDTPPPTWVIESPELLLEESQLQECIERTLEMLSATQKSVFVLRDIEQQPLEDICNILDLSDSNVRVLLHRARLKLLEVIDHYQETGQC